MSFYSNWTGRLYFKKDKFNDSLNFLMDYGWIQADQRLEIELAQNDNVLKCPYHLGIRLVQSKITPTTYICHQCKLEKKEGLFHCTEVHQNFFLDIDVLMNFCTDYGRNFHNVAEKLAELSCDGHLVGSSTDGCFEGYYLTKDVNESFDLIDWGLSHSEAEIIELSTELRDGSCEDEDYYDAQVELINHFIDNFL